LVDPLHALRAAISDRYRVERLLGSGGMATVYLAQDLKHDRPVAIKVLRPELASALGPERFLREIQIAAKLNHPHILTLHDSGEAGGLLFYVMPYVEGESVLERVVREKRLPVEDAVRMGREVASALAYAHARDIVHRDIKPGNILLSNGYALVADFGLARAISRAQSSANITQSGLTIGTPSYMSPEQSLGELELDGRSDIYSLGCVLYELLVGSPPFTASNPMAVLAGHTSGRVPPIRALRPEVPAGVERAVLKALEKAPADRFQTAEEMEKALGAEPSPTPAHSRRRTVMVTLLTVAALAIGAVIWNPRGSGDAVSSRSVDTSHYAVLPFEAPAGVSSDLAVEQLVQDALARWTGISLVDRFQVADMLARRRPGPLSTAEAVRLARTLGAGRFVRGDVTPMTDSLRIHAALYDAAGSRMLQDGTVRVATNLARADSVVTELIDQLLFRGLGPKERAGALVGTSSLPARLAYSQGQAAINNWDLERADSAFSVALRNDGNYAQASLWLGLVRAWSDIPATQWRFAAEQATARRDKLSARDRVLAEAIVAQGRGDYAVACPAWRQLSIGQPNDFAGWFGLATCLRDDPAVLRDPRSPSRWRFRASYQEAVRSYQRAFELLPSVHRAFSSSSYARIQDLLFTSGDRLRGGHAVPPDTTVFFAHPAWAGDSLVFLPFPAQEVAAGKEGTMPGSMHEAVVHQRQLFRDIATAWTNAFPRSADAFEALAVSLDLLGDPSAVETLRRARTLAEGREEQERVAIAEVWLRLKLTTPDDPAGITSVRALGDSLLAGAGSSPSVVPALLAPIAALLGRVQLAAALNAKAAEQGIPPLPTALARDGEALVTYAAFGGPEDSLRNMERRVLAGIRAALTADEQALARRAWLGRAATLAYPDVVLASVTQAPGGVDLMLEAQMEALTRKWDAVRAAFADLRSQRRNLAPEEISVDALFGEARLLVLLGDDRAAADWLDPTLAALRRVAPQTLAWVSGSASLIRAMALRADIAGHLGDRATAAKWARPVTILWSGADPFLQPVVQRMARLTG